MGGKSPNHLLKPMTKPKTLGVSRRAGGLPVEPARAGRPESNIGQYLIKPTPESSTGFEMLNTKPETIKAAQKKYLGLGQLPPGLQPQRLRNPKYTDRPDVLETGRRKGISKGFNKPRSRMG